MSCLIRTKALVAVGNCAEASDEGDAIGQPRCLPVPTL